VGCHLVTLYLFPSNNLSLSHPSATLSLTHTHTPLPPFLSLSDPFFMQSIFSPPFAMVYCNLSPFPVPFCECITRFSLFLFVSSPFSVSLCHIIYSSHPCSRSLLSLSWAIHLSPIKHHPSINLLSIPLFKVIAQSLSLSFSLCCNCLCDP